MKNLSFFLLLAAVVAAQSCDTLRRSTSAKGDVDKTTLAPAEYSTGDRNLDYITKFSRAATLEMERGGIPASIILAQGILESAAGTSDLATKANNHFGIKCGGSWNGKTFYKQDDDYDKDGKLKESCFRKYTNVEESYLDHGEFLRDPKKSLRYGFLFNLERTDYKGWARGLQSAGYATAQDYATKLINLIERYKLYEYDRPGEAPNTFPTKPATEGQPAQPVGPNAPGQPASTTGRIGRVNDVKVVLSREGETLEDVARAYRLGTQKVVDYNDRGYPPGVKLKPNTRIFIQCKKDKWHGRAKDHTVRENQNMFDIAQVYGIRLDKLLERNGLRRGQEPEVNEKIVLRGRVNPSRPIRLRDTSSDPQNSQNANPNAKPSSTTSKPSTSKPPADDELDFEISPDDPTPAKPQPTPTQPETPPSKPTTKPPATTGGTDYPGDPSPSKPGTSPTRPDPQPTQPQAVPRGYHRVEKGDTLFKLSRDYGISVSKIKQMNNLADDNIKIGQLLKVQ
jgi:flagellum-specific peptidoglycan hydrolase FlgJ/LysM repeat protein